MSKINWYILVSIFLCLGMGITIASIRTVKAETSTTFPVGEAGIAAYVKLNSIDITDLTESLYYFHTVEKYDKTHAIGTISVEYNTWYDYPHLYIGLDGWMVAFYLKTEEASRIMQWKGYAVGSINTTTLKDAIDYMCGKIGVTYSEPIKYYDFEFPEANRLTLIAETGTGDLNSFYIIIPGTLYEASYSVYTAPGYWDSYGGWHQWPAVLSVDGNIVFSLDAANTRSYGYYDTDQLEVDKPHIIDFSILGGAATILIHKTY